MSVDFKTMNWLNPPPASEERDGRLVVRSGHHTDFWQNTYYGFEHDNGHFLHSWRKSDFTMEATFTGHYEHLYDQAGLMVRHDAKHWMKCGIEYTDGARHFSTVVTNQHSDWSAFRLDGDFDAISVRVTRMFDALFIQYRTDRMEDWRMARLAYFPPNFPELAIGLVFCSPQRDGFEAEFRDLTIVDPVTREIH